jgi:serine/threonine-protein kinase
MADDRSRMALGNEADSAGDAIPGPGAVALDRAAEGRIARRGPLDLRAREAPEEPDEDPLASLSSIAIGEVIGEGGMGVVRTAIQRSLARTVAIKTTLPGATGQVARRILQEAWVTGFLEHPGVVPVHDILRGDDGAPVVVMRRIRGATWEALLRDVAWAQSQGARDLLEQNLRIFVRVCEVVEFAHAKGVLHRDIKPANVMLGSYGEVYLVDWGLALALGDEAAEHLPRAGLSRELAGTFTYAAPEMVGAVDAPLAEHTDVYLLGAVLFELATGRSPHDKATPTHTFESIAASPPALPADVPARIRAICARAMAKQPHDRHASAAELRRDVLEFLRLRDSEHVGAQAEVARAANEERRAPVREEHPARRARQILVPGLVLGLGWTASQLADRSLQLGVWAMVAASLTAFVERRLWPMTACMIAAFAVAVPWPHLRPIAAALASAAVILNIAAVWRRELAR